MNRIIIISAIMAVAVACGGGSNEPLTTAQLTEVLLTEADVPAGWEEADIPKNPVRPFCGREFPAIATAEVVIKFRENSPTPASVTEFVQAFPPGEAERAMADGLAQIQACTGWLAGDSSFGGEITGRVSLISLPRFGDDTLALRQELDMPGLGTLPRDVIYVRRGDLVITIIYSSWLTRDIDSEQVENFVRRADEKLAAELQ